MTGGKYDFTIAANGSDWEPFSRNNHSQPDFHHSVRCYLDSLQTFFKKFVSNFQNK